MREYAVLDPWGSIVNIVTSARERQILQQQWPSHKVVPLADVPSSAKHAYEFWDNRP